MEPGQRARIDGILETVLYAEDLPRARDFYRDLLGRDPMLDTPRLVAFDVAPAQVLLLFQRGSTLDPVVDANGTIPPHDGGGPVHLAFAVPAGSLPEWEARLAARSIAVEGRSRWPRGGESLYFRDPDGHLLELATPGLWRNY